jgi:hypothetical protein
VATNGDFNSVTNKSRRAFEKSFHCLINWKMRPKSFRRKLFKNFRLQNVFFRLLRNENLPPSLRAVFSISDGCSLSKHKVVEVSLSSNIQFEIYENSYTIFINIHHNKIIKLSSLNKSSYLN